MFPLLLKLAGRPCLLVGAGRVGEGKLQSLLQAGARVTVAAPKATASVQRLARSGEITWCKRKFTARDLEGMVLVVAATSSRQANAAVCQEARRRGVLCNAVDDPRNCDFYYPAVVRRGNLQIAISTAGSSPELAARLRKELEACFGPEYGPWVDYLGRCRAELLAAPLPVAKRQRLLRRLASRRAFQQFLRETSKNARRFNR
jgi:precorrin-2 dehydrogenase/sirohydrochlorin ferrochelatase